MSKKKKHNGNDEEKLEKVKEDVLNLNKSSVTLEPLPDDSWSPFDQPKAKMPNPPADFYFEELLSWTHNGFKTIKHEAYSGKDSIIRHEIFPPELEYERTFPEPYKEETDSMTMEDLSLKDRAGKNRKYTKSPALHVFLLSILEAIKGQPDKFTEIYAKQRSIIKLLEENHDFKYRGELNCIELLVDELATYINSKNYQLIPELYHFRGHGIIMTAYRSLDKMEKVDVRAEPEYTWEFLFSKKSSDNFTRQLIKILHDRQQFILKLNTISSKNVSLEQGNERDKRIDCRADKVQIRTYFLMLAQKNEAGQQIMRKEDIDHLLQANFTGFKPKTKIKKITPFLNQANLRYFVYLFYFQYSKTTHEADVYAHFLKENFTQFENTEIAVIKKGFSRKPAKYPSYLM